jgi:hypothetical protein
MGTTLMDEPDRRGGKIGQGTSLMNTRAGGTRLIGMEGAEPGEASEDPVVGWLVIVEGPGRGTSIELGYGMNIVGRGSANRIALNHGDDSISEEDHFRIAYDVKKRKFHLIPGRGTNLLYVEDEPLLSPQALATSTDFKVGGTTLRFVALCGPDWEWPVDQPVKVER